MRKITLETHTPINKFFRSILSQILPVLEDSSIKFDNKVYPKEGWVVFTVGGPGSGKSYTVDNRFLIDAKVFDPDKLKNLYIQLLKRYINSENVSEEKKKKILEPFDGKLPDLKDKRHASILHSLFREKKTFSKMLDLFIKGLKPETLKNLVIDTTGNSLEKIPEQAEKFKTLGYKTAVVWVLADLSLSLKRVSERERTVSEDYSISVHNKLIREIPKKLNSNFFSNIDEFFILFNTKNLPESKTYYEKYKDKNSIYKLEKSGNNFILPSFILDKLKSIHYLNTSVKTASKNLVEKAYKIIKDDQSKKETEEKSMIAPVPFVPVMNTKNETIIKKIKSDLTNKKNKAVESASTVNKEEISKFSDLLDTAIQYLEVAKDKETRKEEIEALNKANQAVKSYIKLLYEGALPDRKDKEKIEEIAKYISGDEGVLVKNVTELKKLITKQLGKITEKYSDFVNQKNIARYKTLATNLKADPVEIRKLIDFVSNRYGNLEDLPIEKIKSVINTAWEELSAINLSLAKSIAALSPKGYGEGEFFIEFIFEDAQVQGGSVSFDIAAGSKKFEVKCYPNTSSHIRLGTEGGVLNFKAYHLLVKVYTAINNLLSLSPNEFTIFENMCVSAKDKLPINYQDKSLLDVLKTLFSSKTDNRTLLEKLNSGELSASNIESTQHVFDIFKILVESVFENKFEYVKLINKNDIYPVKKNKDETLAITKKPDGSVLIETHPLINKENEVKIIEILNQIRNALYEANEAAEDKKFLDYFKQSITDQINHAFKNHPMILMNQNLISKNTRASARNLCLGVFTKFEFATITMKNVTVKVVS